MYIGVLFNTNNSWFETHLKWFWGGSCFRATPVLQGATSTKKKGIWYHRRWCFPADILQLFILPLISEHLFPRLSLSLPYTHSFWFSYASSLISRSVLGTVGWADGAHLCQQYLLPRSVWAPELLGNTTPYFPADQGHMWGCSGQRGPLMQGIKWHLQAGNVKHVCVHPLAINNNEFLQKTVYILSFIVLYFRCK